MVIVNAPIAFYRGVFFEISSMFTRCALVILKPVPVSSE
jgi:hypothetical protein